MLSIRIAPREFYTSSILLSGLSLMLCCAHRADAVTVYDAVRGGQTKCWYVDGSQAIVRVPLDPNDSSDLNDPSKIKYSFGVATANCVGFAEPQSIVCDTGPNNFPDLDTCAKKTKDGLFGQALAYSSNDRSIEGENRPPEMKEICNYTVGVQPGRPEGSPRVVKVLVDGKQEVRCSTPYSCVVPSYEDLTEHSGTDVVMASPAPSVPVAKKLKMVPVTTPSPVISCPFERRHSNGIYVCPRINFCKLHSIPNESVSPAQPKAMVEQGSRRTEKVAAGSASGHKTNQATGRPTAATTPH